MSDTKTKPIKFKLEKYGDFSFKNIEELESWIQEEREHHDWLSSLPAGVNNAHYVRDKVNAQLNAINKKLRILKKDPENESLLNDLTSYIVESYGKRRLMLSTDADDDFIKQVFNKNNPTFAAHVYGRFLNIPGGVISEPDYLTAVFTYFCYKQGMKTNISAEKSALTKLKNKWQDELTAFKDKFIEVQETGETGNERALTKEGERQAVFDTLIEEKTKELDSVIETYDKKLALQSSISYWKTRATDHLTEARKYSKRAFWSGVVVVVLLSIIAFILFSQVGDPKYWQLITGAVFISFGVWLVRIQVKMYLSNTHLAMDAEERVTMLNTYLALLREGDIPDDENRKLILSTLFKPSHTGLISEDGSPPTAFDFLSQFKK
jgi:predicted DNA-binding protein YlxM (UPF0122 family)